MAGNVELDGDPGFELFNKTAFPNYGGGSTLVLPLLLFIVQVLHLHGTRRHFNCWNVYIL